MTAASTRLAIATLAADQANECDSRDLDVVDCRETDLFIVAERRLNLGRRFNAGVECGRNPQSRSDG